MIIGLDVLLPRVRRGELIRNLAQRELQNPEGVGFDLRVGAVYEASSSGFLGVQQRETSNVTLLATYSADTSEVITLLPSKYYLAKILEEITLDADMLGIFHPRSTLFRSGVVLQTGVHIPGYSGAPTFGIHVAGPHPFRLELGARIAHINILRIEGESSAYRGQWQGGRVSTAGLEKQV
jgi:dUTP pyrophosphatase